MFIETTAVRKIAKLRKRIRAVQGGTSASKTIGILLLLISYAQTDTEPTITSVVSESFPHLRKGAMRDFLNIMQTHRYFDEKRWDKSNSIYTFETGSIIEFFSADQASKVRGPRRHRLFMNECNNMPYETFDQLEVRTSDLIFLDWNPTTEFWYYDQVANRTDVDHIIVTYKDNEGLAPSIVKSIEQRKNRKGWWKVYGLGQLGEVEGRIYTGWDIVDEVPEGARLVRRCLDFGYTNDPTAIVDIYKYNDSLVAHEQCYQTGMLNSDIYAFISNLEDPGMLIIADSSEPKSIAELKKLGLNIIGIDKGRDSVVNGIAVVQDQVMMVTSQSTNLIKEYRNYLFMIDDITGKILNIPEDDQQDHALDAVRYGVRSLVSPIRKSVHVHRPKTAGYVNRRRG